MKTPIPINPAMLTWARETINFPIGEVARRMNKSESEIRTWESGEASPTYVQLEHLAYQIYKRPLALFFFPKPPKEEEIKEDFRTLPDHELARIPPRICFLLRKAKVLQLNLNELYGGKNPAKRKILGDLKFSARASAVEMAEKVRSYLRIDIEQQKRWKGADNAIKYWRDAIEENGIFVFKDSFSSPGKKAKNYGDSESPFSGFCLFDEKFPVIYINNNTPKTRQIFTLFHELAHLLMDTGGVDVNDRQDDYISHLSGDNKRIEVLCNKFAAEFLVPSEDFKSQSKGVTIDEKVIESWAKLYSVSRETISRRLLDQRKIEQRRYDKMKEQWSKEPKRRRSSGGHHYYTKFSYLSGQYIEAVLGSYYQKRISVEQAADYLGAKIKNMPKFERWFLSQRGME